MPEKLDAAIKVCEDFFKSQLAKYEADYVIFTKAYDKSIGRTEPYSGTYSGSGGASWPKDNFSDSPNPQTFGDLFNWMFDRKWGSRYYLETEDKSLSGLSGTRMDEVTGKDEINRKVAAADRIPVTRSDGDVDNIITVKVNGNLELEKIWDDLHSNYDTKQYYSYKKLSEEITAAKFTENIVNIFSSRVTNEGLKKYWKESSPGDHWYDGFQGKNYSMSVGAMDIASRDYPLYQDVFGGTSWVFIDYPWRGKGQVLLDAILEKSNDPSLNTPAGTTASEAAAGASASDAAAISAGASASAPLKYTPFVEGLSDGFQIDAKSDLPQFRIYVSDPKTWKELGFTEEGDFENVEGAETTDEEPDEYSESEFAGLDEQEIKLQDSISNGQEDSNASENPSAASSPVEIDNAIKTTKIGNEDDLYKLAGDLARKLGKNARVNYENMKKGYIKGVHGLCPQGTQAMLAALTGISGLGQITGNADWFSFKSPGTGGGNSTFVKKVGGVVYYNEKTQIVQKSGSWKGTYLDPKSKSQWQVGDIIAMGYTGGKPYGHIQVWTGFSWQSDFRQGNSIQQNHVDPNTVALWRLNDKGIAAVNNQSGTLS